MAKVVHIDIRDQVITAAGLPANEAATIFPLARQLAAWIKTRGLIGFDPTDPADVAALTAAIVGLADVSTRTKALGVAREAGLLVTGL